jgi:chromosome segregation ATPase
MTAANPAAPCPCEKNVGGHSAYLHRVYRALEAENAALKDDLQESEEACEHYASDWNGACTENDALKAELAMEKTQAEQFMHDAFNQKVRAENVEAQVEQQTSLLESCRKALVKVKARVAVYEKHFGVLKEAPR